MEILIFSLLFYLFGIKRKPKQKPNYNPSDITPVAPGFNTPDAPRSKTQIDTEISEGLATVIQNYGADYAADVERAFRLETRNFESKLFKLTNSAGMERHAEKYPYGFTSLKPFWDNNPKYAPIGFVAMREGKGLSGKGGRIKTFLKFNNIESGLLTMAEYKRVFGKVERWYSTNPTDQATYRDALNGITPTITNKLIGKTV